MWEIVGSVVTAFATVILAVITGIYAKLTYSILDEQRKTRKIKELHKKLQCFYIPLWQHILLHQYPNPDKDALEYYKEFNNNTIYKDFMKYMYLCKDKDVRSDLENLLNERKRLGLQDGLIKRRGSVESDIKELVQELEKLQSFEKKD